MTVRHVPGEFATIQAAVDASGPGDTVRVAGGTFVLTEPVSIGAGRDGLALIGAGPGQTILQGPPQREFDGILIQGSHRVTVAGFTITSFLNAILIVTDDNVIQDILATGSGPAFFVRGDRNLLYRVRSTDNRGDGVLVAGQFNYVVNCSLHRNLNDGIDFNAPHSFALYNHASGNDCGLDSMGYNTVAIGNCFGGNTRAGILLTGANHLVWGNRLRGNAGHGAELRQCSRSLFAGNEVVRNQGAGVLIVGGSADRVLLNEVERSGAQSVDLQGNASQNVVDGNQVEESGQHDRGKRLQRQRSPRTLLIRFRGSRTAHRAAR